MVKEATSWFKNNLATYITFANLILLIGLAYGRGQYEKEIETSISENNKEITQNKLEIIKHEANLMVHKPTESLNKLYVPRKELEIQLSYIIKTQDAILKKLK